MTDIYLAFLNHYLRYHRMVNHYNNNASLFFSVPAVGWNSPHILHGDREANDYRVDGEGKQGKTLLDWILPY